MGNQDPGTTDRGGAFAPAAGSVPGSHCIRCGRPTPPGVSLCDVDNPGHIKAPSATQVHGTMLLGVGLGILGFLLLAKLAVGHPGPFAAQVTGQATQLGGAIQVVMRVTNDGPEPASATCRVTRDGSPRSDDAVFRTERIPGHESIEVTRLLPAAEVGQPAYQLDRLTISCT